MNNIFSNYNRNRNNNKNMKTKYYKIIKRILKILDFKNKRIKKR